MLKSIEGFIKSGQKKGRIAENVGVDEIRAIIITELKKSVEKLYIKILPSTHDGKFSNPSAQNVTIKANCKKDNDGYIRTGNIFTPTDMSLKSGAIDIPYATVLSMQLSDDNTIFYHLENNNKDIITADLGMSEDEYREIYEIYTANKNTYGDKSLQTSSLVSQVYFSVNDTFHLLSVLFPSCIMSELKSRINKINFVKKNKDVEDYYRVPNLTKIKIGGSKPQNVSYINNSNSGSYLLFNASPPKLLQKGRIPKKDFFYILNKKLDSYLLELKDLFPEISNVKTRDKRKEIIEDIILNVAENIFELRNLEKGWSKETKLPKYQKILLDPMYEEERLDDDEWFIDFTHDLSKWIVKSCNYIFDSNESFGDVQLSEFKTIIKKNKDMFL